MQTRINPENLHEEMLIADVWFSIPDTTYQLSMLGMTNFLDSIRQTYNTNTALQMKAVL